LRRFGFITGASKGYRDRLQDPNNWIVK